MRPLLGWGSIAPWYEEGEKPSPSYYPTKYQTLPRDTAGYTTFDGRRFDREHSTAEGDVWELPCGEAEFLAQERSHTYLGQGFLKRAFMLLAGIIVNILTGFLLLMSIYSIAGVTVPMDTNVIGQVDEGLLPPRRVSRAVTRFFRLTEYRALPGLTFTMPSARLPVRTISPSSTSVTASSIRPRLRSKRTSA